MVNYLICYEQSKIRKWDMIPENERNAFLTDLMSRPDVDWHTIFIIPTNGFVGGIWVDNRTHKNSRIDFWHFFEEYGTRYVPPVISEEAKEKANKMQQEQEEKNHSKYGFISPDGRYFHCDYQGHTALADRICFGMVETKNAEHYLEEHGWCKIYKSLFCNEYDIAMYGNNVLTDAQMKTLIEMGLDKAEGVSCSLVNDEMK